VCAYNILYARFSAHDIRIIIIIFMGLAETSDVFDANAARLLFAGVYYRYNEIIAPSAAADRMVYYNIVIII